MYKMIACDLDETLYTSDRILSQENIISIKKAISMGVKFVLATGRGVNTVNNTLEDLGLIDKKDQYVISFNGSLITENYATKDIYYEHLDKAQAQAIYQFGLDYDVMVQTYTKTKVYGYRFPQSEKDYLQGRFVINENYSKDLSFLEDEEVVKMIYMNTDYQYLKKIQNEMGSIIKDLTISFSSNRYMEFNKKGISKGSGLEQLCKYLKIDTNECIAIGDNYNDLSMIQVAGLGIGVNNTVEEMKPMCDYITKANNNQSAIAEVIEKFIMRGEKNEK